MNVDIRPLAGTDSLSDLTLLIRRAYSALKERGLRYLATHQDEARTRERCGHGECWVAESGGRILGTIVLAAGHREEGCAWYERPEVTWFEQFAVEPEAQGSGIGRRLLDRVEKRAAELGFEELACDTADTADHLIGMYEKWGYRKVAEVDWPVTNYRSVILSRKLA